VDLAMKYEVDTILITVVCTVVEYAYNMHGNTRLYFRAYCTRTDYSNQ
jgi:hypothetical protein